MYILAMAGVSLSDRMRKCLICDILFYKEYVYIDELVPEQHVNKTDSSGLLCIPPLVMLNCMYLIIKVQRSKGLGRGRKEYD